MLEAKHHNLVPTTITWLWEFLLDLISNLCSLFLQRDESGDTRPTKKPAPTLVSLPNELLIEIVACLELIDIAALRRCCKRLRTITKSRGVWGQAIRRLCKYRLLAPPEEGLRWLTTEALERWVIRREHAQQVWSGKRKPHLNTRVVDHHIPDPELGFYTFYCLLPGGRWLFVGYPLSYTCVFDLDSASPKPQFLFDPTHLDPGIATNRDFVTYAFWDDRSSSQISRVAGSVKTHHAGRSFVYDLKVACPSPGTTALAVLFATFQKHPTPWRSQENALNRQYLVEVLVDPQDITSTREIAVYYYLDACGDDQNTLLNPVARIPFEQGSATLVSFVYDNVFLVHTRRGGLSLFDIVRNDCASCSVNLLYTIPLSYEIPSPMRCSSGVSRLPAVVELGKHDKFYEIEIENIGRLPGISTSVYMSITEEPIHILSHSFGPDRDLPVDFKVVSPRLQLPCLSYQSELVEFSEDVGRLVLLQEDSHDKLVVVDLVPYRYHSN
ncbi:hypothetical protein AN958_02806 [Leucoagaricus sp. SymC.cos]|nr:hypothetical protein AN958_02806 [Leucoagaricus sp. SymC.cos]